MKEKKEAKTVRIYPSQLIKLIEIYGSLQRAIDYLVTKQLESKKD